MALPDSCLLIAAGMVEMYGNEAEVTSNSLDGNSGNIHSVVDFIPGKRLGFARF